MEPTKKQDAVVIAGASGFVGAALVPGLQKRFGVIGLSRRARGSDDGVEWRQCNLFSLLETERAVQGARYAIYLVHSMQPAALTQASFRDIDWVLADNFARACKSAGVEQILYLGGIAPASEELSEHLASRLEVARTLASHGANVTALQAGLIIGPEGSSFRIMLRLVQRLPMMVCPEWTQSISQPIALEDVVSLALHCVGNPETYGQSFDIAGPDALSYLGMMQVTADALGVRRFIATVPVFSVHLSERWVQLFSGAPRELVSPLIESLRHDMIPADLRLQEDLALPGTPFREALLGAIEAESDLVEARPDARPKRRTRPPKVVYSLQRLPLPKGRDAMWVAQTYARWLPRLMRPFIRVAVAEDNSLEFFFVGLKRPLLVLSFSTSRSNSDRPLFYITGGVLADAEKMKTLGLRGRLEFRTSRDEGFVVAAIYDFCPRLPWWIYRLSQAPVHLWVMRRFGAFLARVGKPSDRLRLSAP